MAKRRGWAVPRWIALIAVGIALATVGLIFALTAAQTINNDKSYIGLTENEAMAKAKAANAVARVVERNGESLPATLDFSPGRLNLYIKQGQVYRVNIEGSAAND